MINEDIYQEYLQALLGGDKKRCTFIVKDLLDKDISLYSLYLDLFQRSLYQVGRLWETNQISVATEHMATAITETLLSLAYPKIFSAEHKGKKAVVSCLVNEYHQIGGKMVADIFELNGWDGYFLGANTPIDDLTGMIQEKQPDILALSVSIYFSMDSLYTTLEHIREINKDLKIIVGGQAFNWGGTDIGEKYPGVEYVPSIIDLEKLLKKNE
ncbi:MAG: B12-binding domain-containing protein [Desulfonatronovibrio sp.]